MTKQLSLIILTYNSEKDIFDCLSSVYQYNDIGEALEIIVVDNNSKDWSATEKQIKERFPDVITISNPINGGYGQGNNVGIRASSAPIVSIMNPDVRLIMPVFGAFLKTLSVPDIVMCGGKQLYTSAKVARSFAYDFMSSIFYIVILESIRRKRDNYDYKHMWMEGAFFAVKKDEFQQIGYFDENIFMYCEENDIWRRFRKTFPMLRMVYLSSIKYLHLTIARTFSELATKRQLKSQLYLCKKYNISKRFFCWHEIILIFMQQLICFLRTGNYRFSLYQSKRLQMLKKM